MVQERGEKLKSYVERFHKEVIQMGVFAEKETLTNFWKNLWVGKLWRSFSKDKPETYQEAYSRALEQVQLDEQYRIKIEHDESRSSKQHKGDNNQKKEKEPVPKFRNNPPNRSTYRLPPLPLVRRTPSEGYPHQGTSDRPRPQ